jgi:hypothetical protein
MDKCDKHDFRALVQGQIQNMSNEAQRQVTAPDLQKALLTPANGLGLRYNTGKLRYDLLPPDGVKALVEVYTMGAQKYAARNWEKGLSYMDCVASLKRHLTAFEMGENKDGESGLYHMAHVVWNAMAILVFQLRGIGNDDRPKISL